MRILRFRTNRTFGRLRHSVFYRTCSLSQAKKILGEPDDITSTMCWHFSMTTNNSPNIVVTFARGQLLIRYQKSKYWKRFRKWLNFCFNDARKRKESSKPKYRQIKTDAVKPEMLFGDVTVSVEVPIKSIEPLFRDEKEFSVWYNNEYYTIVPLTEDIENWESDEMASFLVMTDNDDGLKSFLSWLQILCEVNYEVKCLSSA